MRILKLNLMVLGALTLVNGQPPGGGQGDGIWRRNAHFGEIQTLDACAGHQPGSGDYHYHANPICLRYEAGDNVELVRNKRTGSVYREKSAPWKHSPILGWAWDGYPIYGPYGYADARSAASAIRRVKSGFRLRNITARTSIPDWTLPNHAGVNAQLTTTQYGPAINDLFPLGRYVEDYEFVTGPGDLDVYNGRFAVTPEYPQGTYAYYVTIDDSGHPAFPYLISGQLYGTASGGRAQTVPTTAEPFFENGRIVATSQTSPSLTAWLTKYSTQNAQVVSSFNPAGGPKTTWPSDNQWNTRTSGGTAAPLLTGPQRIRFTETAVYVNSPGTATHTMGPWFDPLMTGGDFVNYPSNQNFQMMLPRSPVEAATKSAAGMGPQGLWINGTSLFSFLDGASYSNTRGTDGGGGAVAGTMQPVSMFSWERGPVAPGALLIGYSLFGAKLADRTETASGSWPTSLGGATVTVRDSAGATFQCELLYASSTQLYFRIPDTVSPGNATLTVAAGTNTYTSNVNIQSAYPHLAIANADDVANANVIHVRGTQQTFESSVDPFSLDGDAETYLVLYGSGRGKESSASATIGGVAADVTYAGAYSAAPGVDQYNVRIPKSLAGKGELDVVITLAGRASNAVRITIR